MQRLVILSLLLLVSCAQDNTNNTMERARVLAEEYLIIDGHIDVPYRMTRYTEDISQATIGGDFDYPRAVAGVVEYPIHVDLHSERTPGYSWLSSKSCRFTD